MFKRKNIAELPHILEAIRYGDERAYNTLIDRTYNSVLAYCCAFGSRPDSHDLAQETYLRAIKSNFTQKNIESIEGYLITIAKCVCSDYIREKQKLHKLKISQHSVNSHPTNNIIDINSAPEYLNILSDDMRECFILTQLLGFSYEETAQLCNVSIGTVKSRVARSKEALRKHLQVREMINS